MAEPNIKNQQFLEKMRGFLKNNFKEEQGLKEVFKYSKDIQLHPEILTQVTETLLAQTDPKRDSPTEFADFLNLKNILKLSNQETGEVPKINEEISKDKGMFNVFGYSD
jgi:hypothetical protein